MSTIRRSKSTYGTAQPRNEAGQKVCYECKGPIPKPRRTFCSSACVDRWKIRTDPGWVRQKVFERDKGVCALCGVDCIAANPHPNGRVRTPRARGTGHLWQADHIIPVVEGGGECGIENYRTLCTACHRKVTKELAARSSFKRRREKISEAEAVLSRPLRFGDASHKDAAKLLERSSASSLTPRLVSAAIDSHVPTGNPAILFDTTNNTAANLTTERKRLAGIAWELKRRI